MMVFQMRLASSNSLHSLGSCSRMSFPWKMFWRDGKKRSLKTPVDDRVSCLKLLPLLHYLQVDPLALHSEHHLCHLQHHRQLPLPAVHLLLKGPDKVRRLHSGQRYLVVLQCLENLVCAPGDGGTELVKYQVPSAETSNQVRRKTWSFRLNFKDKFKPLTSYCHRSDKTLDI